MSTLQQHVTTSAVPNGSKTRRTVVASGLLVAVLAVGLVGVNALDRVLGTTSPEVATAEPGALTAQATIQEAIDAAVAANQPGLLTAQTTIQDAVDAAVAANQPALLTAQTTIQAAIDAAVAANQPGGGHLSVR